MLQVDIHSFGYAEKEIINDIAFKLEKGTHLSVLGESGCGKTTLLHLIYGLLHLEHGSIQWNETTLLGPQYNLIPGEPFIKLVAQEFDLMPFISVSENISSHLTRRDQEQDDHRVQELLHVVDLSDFSETKVQYLSGGQKQRVALAKALAKAPELLLLDEPFSSIDSFRKNKLRRDLFEYLKRNNISCITATHDSEEALAFSDTLMILKEGKIDAFGSPEEIFNGVSSVYQAGFFGDVNVIPASFLNSENPTEEHTHKILLPHQLLLATTETKLKAIVKNSYFRGSNYLIKCEWMGKTLYFEHSERLIKQQFVYLKIR